jgi:hypothetical protein
MRIRKGLILRLQSLLLLLLVLVALLPANNAWEWSDFVGGGSSSSSLLQSSRESVSTTTLSIQEVSELRVRDIKRRLSRNHGYSAEELGRILDKKELIHALAFEEEKLRLSHEAQAKRILIQQGIIAAIVAILLILCWPLFQHAYEVASINFVVFTDRKKHEVHRCFELQSVWGMIGVVLMGILDILQVWLTASILLSWVMTSKYFFPVPRLSVRPAQLLGGEIAKSHMANYGINIGSMLVTWVMRFGYGKIEMWTGNALSAAHRKQRKEARQWESADDKAARKEARRIAKLEKQQRQQQATVSRPGTQGWIQPMNGSGEPPVVINSRTHQEFLNHLDEDSSNVDENTSKFDEHTSDLDEYTSALDELD